MHQEFKRLWLNEPWEDPDKHLVELGLEYHRRAEMQDRAVCSHVLPNGVVMPANGRQLALINARALLLRREIAKREGLTIQQLQEGIRLARRAYEAELAQQTRHNTLDDAPVS